MSADAGVLMARVAGGDQSAFAELYDQLAPMVYGIVRRVVRDPTHSEEVTQEVFVELWRKAARFDSARGRVRSWAVTIAHRRAVDRVRSEQSLRDRQLGDCGGLGERARQPIGHRARLPRPGSSTSGVVRAERRPTTGARARVLRRADARRGRRAARRCARDHQDADPAGADPAAWPDEAHVDRSTSASPDPGDADEQVEMFRMRMCRLRRRALNEEEQRR